jgi:hypothetical protein
LSNIPCVSEVYFVLICHYLIFNQVTSIIKLQELTVLCFASSLPLITSRFKYPIPLPLYPTIYSHIYALTLC